MANSETRNENALELLLAKATNPLHDEPDPDIVNDFCTAIDNEQNGPQTALRLLAHKIQSPIEKESLMALSVLQESVRKCGTHYRAEIGKFRFLNEMIKVVSPKYLGNRASSKVKRKIVEIMYLWSLELKNESKISEAYQMLKKQGVVIEDPVYLLDNYTPSVIPPPPRSANSIFEDEEKAQQLQRLLRSKNAEDLQAANRLIKSMVKEADHRMEVMAKRSTELETVHNNASVLSDMLDHYRPGETSDEEKDLMKELFESCERLRPKLFRLAGELDEKDEGLGDILKANDELTVVINNYKKLMCLSTENGKPDKKEASLLDLGTQSQCSSAVPPANSLLDDQLLALGLMDDDKVDVLTSNNSLSGSSNTSSSVAYKSSLADLDTIFSSSLEAGEPNVSLQPVIRNTNNSITSSVSPITVPSSQDSIPGSKGLEELEEISKSLLKKSMPSSVKYDFPSSTPQKVPLSQLMQQQKAQPKNDIPISTLDKSNFLSSSPLTADKVSPSCSPSHILSLKDIFVPLETIQPGFCIKKSMLFNYLFFNLFFSSTPQKVPLSQLMQQQKAQPKNDIPISTLDKSNFLSSSPLTADKVSPSCSPSHILSLKDIFVPLETIQPGFSMKIKLQPPSATDLPPYNPILPPATITQVMLLANPQNETVRLKYKVNYLLNEKELTDSGEVDNLFAPR
nr:ADP-ribosylation factor-binding protein GGA1 [Parasteatoda tepidariorum]